MLASKWMRWFHVFSDASTPWYTYTLVDPHEPYINCYLIYRHMVYYCIIYVLVFQLLKMLLPVGVPLTFLGNSKIYIFFGAPHSFEALCSMEIYFTHFVLAQFYPKNTMSQLLLFDIKYQRIYYKTISSKNCS